MDAKQQFLMQTKLALSLGSHGNVTPETMRAFTEPEVKEIVAGLGAVNW